VQILVYVGGVMVLFLFVIMLVNVGEEERGREEIFNRSRQVVTSVIFCGLLAAGLLYAINLGYEGLQKRDAPLIEAGAQRRASQEQNLAASATGSSRISTQSETVGGSLFRFGSLPFEIASVLLLVAIVGSVMLARTLKQEAVVDDAAPTETTSESELAMPQTDPVVQQ
jgi:NADH-quinone oxidoreductase subunit J